jgi:hypothetical protein
MHGNNPLPDWRTILGSDMDRFTKAREAARGGQKVLLATSVGGMKWVGVVDGLLAAALTLRGADVHALLCDGVLPACEMLTYENTPDIEGFAQNGIGRDCCEACHECGKAMYESLGISPFRYSAFLDEDGYAFARSTAADTAAEEIPGFVLDGCHLGEHALAGALRFFAKDHLEDEPHGEAALRRYFQAALLTRATVHKLLSKGEYKRAVFHHGIYVPQGVVGETARALGVGVVNYNPAYRKKCFIFSHGGTYHHTLMSEPTSCWEDMDMTPAMEQAVVEYLQSRWSGSNDWIWFHEGAQRDSSAIAAELGLDLARPVIGLLTNVVWDAQLHYPANAFPGMIPWVVRTIEHFAERPELQLVIRVHPAELTGTLPSRRAMQSEIARHFPVLPDNVCVVGPDSPASTYALMGLCDSVLIYGTKTGVELTSMGIPVIVAGEAWIRGKGLTWDARSVEEYLDFLGRLPVGERLAPAIVSKARKYAFHFFFRRMIPVRSIVEVAGWPPFGINRLHLDDLVPGQDPGLDVIMDGILHGDPFIYPAHKLFDTPHEAGMEEREGCNDV